MASVMDDVYNYKQCRDCGGTFRRRGFTLHQNKCPARVAVCASCERTCHRTQDAMTCQTLASGGHVWTCRKCLHGARALVHAIKVWQAR